MNQADFEATIRRRMRRHLKPDEELKWVGRPHQALWRWPLMSLESRFSIIYGLTGMAFGALLFVMYFFQSHPLSRAMVVIGASGLISLGVLLYGFLVRRLTCYAVSQSRAFVWLRLPLRNPRSIVIPADVFFQREEPPTFTLIIDEPEDSGGARLHFRGLEHPQEVYPLLVKPAAANRQINWENRKIKRAPA